MAEVSLESLGLILLTTLLTSLILVPIVARLAHWVGAIDYPKRRSSHVAPIPRMGGLAISLSFAIACIVYLPFDSFLLAFLSGLAVVALTGVIDDVLEVSHRWKFAGQVVAASLFVYLSGASIMRMGDIVGIGNIELGTAAPMFTVFCIVGGMNAFNFFDGLDGLAGGLTVIAMMFFAYFAWIAQSGSLLIVTVSLIGAIIGFLRYNRYPAKIFMGDNGSLMLGYVSSVLVVSLCNLGAHLSSVTLVMVIALPLLDTLRVMALRVFCGQSPFLPDRTHLHHRLLDLGLPHPVVVVVIYLVMLGFGLLSIEIRWLPEWAQFMSLIVFGGLVFGVVSLFQYMIDLDSGRHW